MADSFLKKLRVSISQAGYDERYANAMEEWNQLHNHRPKKYFRKRKHKRHHYYKAGDFIF